MLLGAFRSLSPDTAAAAEKVRPHLAWAPHLYLGPLERWNNLEGRRRK
jgi:hypothetical protein